MKSQEHEFSSYSRGPALDIKKVRSANNRLSMFHLRKKQSRNQRSHQVNVYSTLGSPFLWYAGYAETGSCQAVSQLKQKMQLQPITLYKFIPNSIRQIRLQTLKCDQTPFPVETYLVPHVKSSQWYLASINFPNALIGTFRTMYLRGSLDRRALHSTGIRNGIVENVKSAYEEARGSTEEKQMQKIFETQLSYLRSKDMMTPQVFDSLLQDMKAAAGLSGIREHLPWVQNNPALGEFKEQERIISAMTPSQKKDAFSIKISDKRRLARDTKASMESVDALVTQITQMRRIQKWLWKREKDGLPLPSNSVEMERMISASGGIKVGKEQNKWPNPGVPMKEKKRRGLW